ncbi:hypothetical protein B0H10DRAFT_1207645 [Mycena sp. CBHHK59/15]|nr:hypothetical protein B0H10DRAFT_1207645 [Mycena sp. CBHHK59/15]
MCYSRVSLPMLYSTAELQDLKVWGFFLTSSMHSRSQVAGPPPYEQGYNNGYDTSKPLPAIVASSSQATEVKSRPVLMPSVSGSYSNVCIQNRFADITGTYYIDPKNPVEEITKKNRRKKRQHRKRIPDAIFRTRRGKITLDLGTTGYAAEVPKASVVASTKSGNIGLNLISGSHAKPRFDLEVNTRSGNIVLFVTNTFSGVIQLHTKTGNLEFLPGIAAGMQVVKSADTEYLVLVGNPQPEGGSALGIADFARLSTRTGKSLLAREGRIRDLMWLNVGFPFMHTSVVCKFHRGSSHVMDITYRLRFFAGCM